MDGKSDPYRRFAEDIVRLSQLQLNSCRFVISWTAVQSSGRGPCDQVALDFYDRLIDCLLALNIQPFVTLYQCRSEQSPFASEIWSRETCALFAQYGARMIERYGDRVKHWTTFDETPGASYAGRQGSHHLLPAHCLASQAMRQAARSPVAVGIGLHLSAIAPHRAGDLLDIHLAESAWRNDCGRYLDALILGQYSAEKLDFVGINLGAPDVVSARPQALTAGGAEYTEGQSLRNLLNRIDREYHRPALYVTGNEYVRGPAEQCALALKDGVDLRGYFACGLV
ncbi:MAG: family 1 glycosylhydrolase [Cyanobacteria bacterium SZAS LIN-2]|nr:family 1 glycosylhydrolase [Cyanobacteria bacterium SZAS LIN-2]